MIRASEVAGLSADEVRSVASDVYRPGATPHWSLLAALLGATEDRRLYEDFGFPSTRAWAETELDLSHDDCLEALKLWRLMAEGLLGQPPVDLVEWGQLAKGRALIVARAVKMGGPIRAWFERALAADSEEQLRNALKEAMGDEVWIDLTLSLPGETAKLFEAALMLALREVFPGQPMTQDEARAAVYRRDVQHRAVEVLAAHYVGDLATP